MQYQNEIQIHPQLGLDLIIAARQLRFISLQPAAEGNAVARLAYGPKRAPNYLLISKPRQLPAPTPGASLHTRPSSQCPHLLPTYPTTQPQSTDTCVLTASESTNYLGKWPRAERQLAGGYIQDPSVASPTAAVADFRAIRNWKFVRTCTGRNLSSYLQLRRKATSSKIFKRVTAALWPTFQSINLPFRQEIVYRLKRMTRYRCLHGRQRTLNVARWGVGAEDLGCAE
jgi:hypothetical protein